MSKKFSKIIRYITVAPIIAIVMLTLMWFIKPLIFLNFFHYIMSMVFLAVFPVLAYPISLFFFKKNNDNRTLQRNLAFVFALIGYVCGVVFCLVFQSPESESLIYLTYLFSGVLITVINFIFKFKASGHTSGVSGPIAMISFQVSPWFLFAYPFMAVIFVASLKLKRHNLSQLLVGSVIPIVAMAISYGILCLI